MRNFDFIVIGAGIVGLSSAYHLTRKFPGKKILVLEKESKIAAHQTGHNSGVIHTGIYYKPGSAKALNCTTGKKLLEQFCKEHKIPYQICGKIIVAVTENELPQLSKIPERGVANGVKCCIINADEMRELEPHVSGVKALHVPEAGIISYPSVCEKLAELIKASGGEIMLSSPVVKVVTPITDPIVVITKENEFSSKFLINCAGIYSDRIARICDVRTKVKMVPFKGEYFELSEESKHLCRNLIYPVPDPDFPFLGVHFTRMISGDVECGPNAILAFAREGYGKWETNFRELFETLTYSGFLKLALRHFGQGAAEFHRSMSKAAFVRALQRLVPAIEGRHLSEAPCGIRAQAVAPDGKLVDDFVIETSGRMVHVLNAPSPAATSSLSIGETIVSRISGV